MMIRFSLFILAIAVLTPAARPAEAADDLLPTLRQANYLAILPQAGRPCEIQLKAQRYSPAYSDMLNFTLIGPNSSTIATGEVLLGEEFRLSTPKDADGLHVLELDSGWNACRVDPGETPAAFVARETVPLHTAREVEFFFYVPTGMKRFSIWLVAGAPREGARVEIKGPEGRPVVEEEGDYDRPQRVGAAVPAGCDGKVWSLSLLKPKAAGLHVDDVKLWLDPGLAPYLSTREDWALTFGKRKHP